MGVFTNTFTKGLVQHGIHSSPLPVIPDGAIVTLSGIPILTTNGDYIYSVPIIPLNALFSLSGSPIMSTNNEYITI